MSGTISAYATRVLHKSALQRKENSFLLDLSLYLKGGEGGRHAFSELSRITIIICGIEKGDAIIREEKVEKGRWEQDSLEISFLDTRGEELLRKAFEDSFQISAERLDSLMYSRIGSMDGRILEKEKGSGDGMDLKRTIFESPSRLVGDV